MVDNFGLYHGWHWWIWANPPAFFLVDEQPNHHVYQRLFTNKANKSWLVINNGQQWLRMRHLSQQAYQEPRATASNAHLRHTQTRLGGDSWAEGNPQNAPSMGSLELPSPLGKLSRLRGKNTIYYLESMVNFNIPGSFARGDILPHHLLNKPVLRLAVHGSRSSVLFFPARAPSEGLTASQLQK